MGTPIQASSEGRIIPRVFVYANDVRMRQPFLFRGNRRSDVETLLANVRQDLLKFLVRVLAFHQSHIDCGLRFFWDHVLGRFTDVSTMQTTDVQRGNLEEVGQSLATSFRLG